MLTVLLILFPFISALIVFFTKGRLARNLALTFSVFEFIIALVAFVLFTHNPNLSILCFNHTWVQSLGISFSVSINGLSLLMILLTTFLVPLIILSSFNNLQELSSKFYGLILIYCI